MKELYAELKLAQKTIDELKTIEKDQNIKSQLYSARSPAHAYNILNAEKIEEYNYFL